MEHRLRPQRAGTCERGAASGGNLESAVRKQKRVALARRRNGLAGSERRPVRAAPSSVSSRPGTGDNMPAWRHLEQFRVARLNATLYPIGELEAELYRRYHLNV